MNLFGGLYARMIFALLSLAIASEVAAQQVIASNKVEVTTNKTSTIVFPYKIAEVDRGSRDILVQQPKGITNILKVKAGKLNFKETNLTVITDDGTIYLFPMAYAEQPAKLTTQANEFISSISAPVFFKIETTSAQLEDIAEKIIETPSRGFLLSEKDNDMKLSLKGIYIWENTLFYHLDIANNSNIPFHTDMIRFYVKDKKKAKRTASQEAVQVPVYRYGDPFVIPGKESTELVYAIPKFTFPDAKLLNIQLMEKGGGRHLRLQIKNKAILKAKQVPSL